MSSAADDRPEETGLEGAQATLSAPVPEPEAAPAPAANDERFPLAEPGEYYSGLWSGIPNYSCPYCMYATLEGSGAVELHILERIEQGSERHQAALKTDEGGQA